MIRFGHDWDPECMVMDETLYATQAKVQNFAVMYLGEYWNLLV
jgi:U5 snRNP protein, DIM1 family